VENAAWAFTGVLVQASSLLLAVSLEVGGLLRVGER